MYEQSCLHEVFLVLKNKVNEHCFCSQSPQCAPRMQIYNDKPKCANCGGSHSAVLSQCRAYTEAKSALATAVKAKLS